MALRNPCCSGTSWITLLKRSTRSWCVGSSREDHSTHLHPLLHLRFCCLAKQIVLLHLNAPHLNPSHAATVPSHTPFFVPPCRTSRASCRRGRCTTNSGTTSGCRCLCTDMRCGNVRKEVGREAGRHTGRRTGRVREEGQTDRGRRTDTRTHTHTHKGTYTTRGRS